jgi:hypothetical protein
MPYLFAQPAPFQQPSETIWATEGDIIYSSNCSSRGNCRPSSSLNP